MQQFDQDFPTEKQRLPFGGAAIKGVIVTGIVLAIIMATREPMDGGPQVILLFLATLFFMVSCVVALILQIVWAFYKKTEYSWGQLLYSSITLAFGLVFLLGLQTLGQLRAVDMVLVAILEVVLLFYIIRRF